ncbi:MAG: hypothetical protein JW804_04430 [Sedimentisphaerales bacterium]|nr:hypothetical protein [Sedimentisphaerales bacterium]
MKKQEQFLQKLTQLIEASGIPYAVCGSICSSLHGQPRATNDADIIISPTREQLAKLIRSLGTGCYVSPEAAFEAMGLCSMFNVIDSELGWKADLIFLKKSPYHLAGFNRRVKARVMGIDLWILSAEDVILSKLNWAKNTDSQLQYRDVLGVIKLQWDKLDWDYLRHWAKGLGVEKNLEKIVEEAGKIRGE